MKPYHYSTAPTNAKGFAYTEPFKIPEGTKQCLSVFVRVKRREADPVGDGPILIPNPTEEAPEGYCIIRVSGGEPGVSYRGTASFQ